MHRTSAWSRPSPPADGCRPLFASRKTTPTKSTDGGSGTAKGASLGLLGFWALATIAATRILAAPGEVLSHQKISDTQGGFTGYLTDQDYFGCSLASLGDLDGDGTGDLAVGAMFDNDGGRDHGAVWVLFLNNDGSVRAHQKISDTAGGFDGDLGDYERFGSSVASLADLDGDGTREMAVGAYNDDDGGLDRGAVWVLFLRDDGTVKRHQKISDTQGGFTGILADSDYFGTSIASLGDLDGDGVGDLATGAVGDDGAGSNRGAVWVLFLNDDGTVKAHQKISETDGGFGGVLDDLDYFGRLGALGDLDGDGTNDVAVGAVGDDDGGNGRGAVWLLFLNGDGTVRTHQKISDTEGGFAGALSDRDHFGSSVTSLGDIDEDGSTDLAVGALLDDDGGTDRGAVWVLLLNDDGTVRAHQKISDTEGGFNGAMSNEDYFGCSLASLGDLDGDGAGDLAAGAEADDDGGPDRGAVWVLFLSGPGATPVTLDYFTADRAGTAAILRWRVAEATVHAGFDVYREGAAGGREKVNQELLREPGGIYRFVDELAGMGEIRYWLAEVSIYGDLRWHGPVVVAAVEPGWPGLADLRVRPNPFGDRTSFECFLPAGGAVRLLVYDAVGRVVAVPMDEAAHGGVLSVVWDGRDGHGEPVAAGVYFARLETEGRVTIRKVTVAR